MLSKRSEHPFYTPNGNTSFERIGEWGKEFYKYRYAYLFISPFFILFIVFFLYPTLRSFYLSTFKWEGFGRYTYVGFDNYIKLAKDPLFRSTLGNSIVLMLMSMVPQIVLSVILAVLINAKFVRFKKVWRTIYFLPITLSPVIVAVIFTLIFDENYGFLNYILSLLNISPVGWLTTVKMSKISVATLVVWRWTGWNIVVLLAALQGIPQDLQDAAAVDGANEIRIFRHITLPLLKPTIVYLAMLGIIDGLRIFAEPSVLTRGGPAKSSMTVMMYLYNQAFAFFNYGYASTIAVVTFLIIVVISAISWKIIGKNNQE